MTALEQPARIRWGMATHAEVTITKDDPTLATLAQDGKTITARVIAPADARLKIYEMETPPHDYDVKNPNTRMLGFETQVGAGQEETLVVVMGDSVEDVVSPSALADW